MDGRTRVRSRRRHVALGAAIALLAAVAGSAVAARALSGRWPAGRWPGHPGRGRGGWLLLVPYGAGGRSGGLPGRPPGDVPGTPPDPSTGGAAAPGPQAPGVGEAGGSSAPDLARLRLLARFETPVVSAQAGRVANIRLAAAKIDGHVVPPGGEFSFNRVVGPRDPQFGWQAAPELYSGEFVVGYGGGVCQVSSTLFNSVLLAGLPVTERHHHSRPLTYVDLGRDATVAWDGLDFRFRNTTAGPVQIRARLRSGSPQRIEVALYGAVRVPAYRLRTRVDRYTPPEIAEIPDSSLPVGRRLVVEEGRPGYQVRVIRTGPDGREEVVARAFYAPRRGHVVVGTALLPAPRGDARAAPLPVAPAAPDTG